MAVYDDCSAAHASDLELTMKCVFNWVESETSRLQRWNEQMGATGTGVSEEDFTTWMLLLTGSLVFFMQAGECVLAALLLVCCSFAPQLSGLGCPLVRYLVGSLT